MKRFRAPIALGVLFAAVVVATWIPLPYYAIGPGPAREVTPLIHVDGPTLYASQGRFIMTTVSYRQVTALTALFAWLDPSRSVVRRNELFLPGESPAQEQERALSQMDTSKIDAATVVLRRLTGYPLDHGKGALLESVGTDCPAGGKLFAGDLVTAIDGTAVTSEQQARKLLDAIPTKDPITFRVTAGGQTENITLTRGRCVPGEPPLVGITLIDNFPYRISIESGEIGGPSAGMMYALGLYDLLTPGDLTGGRTIAGTGTIDPYGNVGEIGGIQDKIVAAERVGAQVFLVPQKNYAAAAAVVQPGMNLVPISTFQDALDYLERTP